MHDKSIIATMAILGSNATLGLSTEEVILSESRNGRNSLPTKKPTTLLNRFVGQFKDILIIILLVSAILSAVLAVISSESWAEPIIIVSIVIVNAILGTAQQYRTDKALSKLDTLSVTTCTVLRGGVVETIDSRQLVVGDVVMLSVGNVVPADCRIISSSNLEVNEASLTGESLPVHKGDTILSRTTPIAERINCLFGGTYVTKGKCTAVVYSVGGETEIGVIASQLATTNKGDTPLKRKLDKLGKVIGVVCIAVCVVVFIMSTIIGLVGDSGEGVLDTIMTSFIVSISLAVAAIPEGLPAIVTLVLARGIQRMASVNCVVKNLTAVETLGSANVICTDKTGTLTYGSLSVESMYTSKLSAIDDLTSYEQRLLQLATYCCDVVEGEQYVGDPMEVAIVRNYSKYGSFTQPKRLFELPFDSKRKKMTVVVEIGSDYYVITKGSIDNMPHVGDKWIAQAEEMSSSGLRVIALSIYKVDSNFPHNAKLEENSNVVALLAFSDAVRTNAQSAVATCMGAGIRPIMLTGDSLLTAISVATKLSIYTADKDMAIDSNELLAMSDSQLDSVVESISVYARVTPSDKVRIVSAWQRRGAVTAMTGDGVNDAVALKQADIGCAMGISGTDVAKESADMVLLDDNFGSIVDGVAEGRTVHNNIVKSVMYLLSCNIGEVICVVLALVLFGVSPLYSIQLLWVNLVTDGLPSLALGLDRKQSDVMLTEPNSTKGFFANGQGVIIALYGILIGVITVVAYYVGLSIDSASACTMAFIVLSMSQLFFAMELRGNRSILVTKPSLLMTVAALVSMALVGVVVFVPTVMSVFMLVSLPLNMYAVCLILAMLPMLLQEIRHLANYISAK